MYSSSQTAAFENPSSDDPGPSSISLSSSPSRADSTVRLQCENSLPLQQTVSSVEKFSIPTATPSWASMPNKGQLAILACSRLVDFWQMASLQSCMIHQLRSFDDSLSEAEISRQGGILQGSFTAAQVITSIVWGRVADRPNIGRKNVLLIGLVGTSISMVGVAFSSSFCEATTWRLLAGAINGTVGSARTMVAESVPKPYHARAFLLLPAAFNVANILGPVLGGLLSDPIARFPATFGVNSTFGGATGVQWLIDYPYALPNLLCAFLLLAEALLVTFLLRETLEGFRGTSLRWTGVKSLYHYVSDLRRPSGYRRLVPTIIDQDANGGRAILSEMEKRDEEKARPWVAGQKQARLSFKQIWTPNVIWTLLSVAVFDFHMGAFSSLWITFLSTKRQDPTTSISFLHFDGGLAFDPGSIGFSLSILGIVGLILQLTMYPWANGRFGLMRCFRYALFLFPLAYFIAPYLSILPSISKAPQPASGFAVWFGICLVLFFQVTARTFALPASILLINNCTPHPSVLATIHGLGQSTSSAFRTVGPIAAGCWYSLGLQYNIAILAWWLVALISLVGCVISFWVKDGAAPSVKMSEKEDVEGQGQIKS